MQMNMIFVFNYLIFANVALDRLYLKKKKKKKKTKASIKHLFDLPEKRLVVKFLLGNITAAHRHQVQKYGFILTTDD